MTAPSLEKQSEPEEPLLIPGECVGRYTVRGLLGKGGMGEVYAAHDPELDRVVAIKLLRADAAGPSPESRARFQREAQAMARLNHPNVVSVYDVGTFGDRIFVTMERVEGPTLAQWSRAAPRLWSEVVAMFREAGRGLEAAHSAGIVHRDFKPSNVIVGERVRVVDFGLARSAGQVEPGVADELTSPLRLDVTRTGHVLGTPAYMAPEQKLGSAASALSDQYSYGVALYEALTGALPSDADPEARLRRVPSWLRKVVKRALQERPEDRYRSMTELLHELGRDRLAPAWAAVVPIVLLASVAWWRTTAAPVCAGAEARFAGVWDTARAEAVRSAFVKPSPEFGQRTFEAAKTSLDAYVKSWASQHLDACRATRVEGRQSDTMMDLRMACLDRRRAVLGSLVDLWLRGVDTEKLATVHDAVAGLPPLSECADQKALAERAPLPTDPAQVATIAQLRAELDTVQAQQLSGRWKEAGVAAEQLRARAEATGWPQVRAEAAYACGLARWSVDDPAAAERWLEASRFGAQARDDRLVARAQVALVETLAHDKVDATKALLAAELAEAALLRSGDDPDLRARLMCNRGDVLLTEGKFDEAIAAMTEARAWATRVLGARHEETLRCSNRLAAAAWQGGRTKEAKKLSEENLAVTVALLGPDHPRVASALSSLGGALISEDDALGAVEYFRRALTILEKVSGPEAATTAMAMANLGAADLELDRLDEADALISRSQAVRERTLGPDHPRVAQGLSNFAGLRRKQGRFDEALEMARRALAIKERTYGPEHASTAYSHEGIADILWAEGKAAAALVEYQRALEIRKKALGDNHWLRWRSAWQVAQPLTQLERCGEARSLLAAAIEGMGPKHPDLALAQLWLAECDLREGRPTAALEGARRAMEQFDKTGGRVTDRGLIRWLICRSLDASGQRAEARAAAQLVEVELAGDATFSRQLGAARTLLGKR